MSNDGEVKRSTAIRHLVELAEAASDGMRLRDTDIGWPLEELWVTGELRLEKEFLGKAAAFLPASIGERALRAPQRGEGHHDRYRRAQIHDHPTTAEELTAEAALEIAFDPPNATRDTSDGVTATAGAIRLVPAPTDGAVPCVEAHSRREAAQIVLRADLTPWRARLRGLAHGTLTVQLARGADVSQPRRFVFPAGAADLVSDADDASVIVTLPAPGVVTICGLASDLARAVGAEG